MAFGPYLELGTTAFDSLELGAGGSWLIPAFENFPVVVSAGPIARNTTAFGWEPAVSSTIFVGSRSYNFHSVYGLAAGFFVQGRYGFGEGKQADVLGGVQLDLALLALPFVYAYEAIRR